VPRTVRDDFYVLMWNFYDPLYFGGPGKAALAVQRFREMHCNGGTLIATFVDPGSYDRSLEAYGLPLPEFERPEMGASPFAENDFPFYVMNICRPMYWNWGDARPIFREWYESFERERDRKVFTRMPCMNDPSVKQAMNRYTTDVMEGLREARGLSLLYDLRDEPSVGSFLLATDLCFCEHCMGGMRGWLKDRYSSLEALNAGWGTAFESWEAVEPLTTQEAFERRESGNFNFAAWHDHRTFMNDTFVGACRQQAGLIHEHDPQGAVGLAGTQCPWVFGGYDFAKLVPEMEWVEAYDFGQSADCFRSFKKRRDLTFVKTSGLGGSIGARLAMIWAYVFQSGGYAGTIVWESNSMVDVEDRDLPLNDGARELGRGFAELRSGIPRLLQLTEEKSSPVAVHYSQASINADFITAVAPRWRSVAAAEAERFPTAGSRAAWWKLMEDRGLRPLFVSERQIESGELLSRGFKALVLPRSIAISDAEAGGIREFVKSGGTLIADSFVGRMDERCREREAGVLDEFLGIRRLDGDRYHSSAQRGSISFEAEAEAGVRPRWGRGGVVAECELIEERIEPLSDARVMGCTEYTDTPLGIVREHGKGRTVLFNCAPLDHLRARRGASGGAGTQAFFGEIFARAGIEAELKISGADGAPLGGWRVFPFVHGKARYFGVAPDMGVTQDVLGAISVEGAEGAGVGARIGFPVSGHLYEMRSGIYLGEGDEADFDLDPTGAPIFAVLPYRAEGLDLKVSDGKVSANLRTSKAAGEHVFRFELVGASGEALLDRGANVVAPGGRAEWSPEGEWLAGASVFCRDVATGVAAEAGFQQAI